MNEIKIFFIVLVLSVVFVNGWTDAPNAIASCISSRAMSPKKAVALAGVCNLSGALAAAFFASGVAKTVSLIVDFGDDNALALNALSVGMIAVVLWAVLAFIFGIPTSESHALMAGIAGAAFGARMNSDALNVEYILIVLLGLIVSTLPAYFLSKWIYSVLLSVFDGSDRRRSMRYFIRAQRFGAAGSAFMHGAQDSQKFVGVLMLGLSLCNEESAGDSVTSATISVLCAVIMTFGTFCGGGRIIKKVGDEMVNLDACAGAASDVASSIVLCFCTVLGVPVSTTHSKTCAMMGAGSISSRGVNKRVVKQMISAWVLTFPCCGALGFLLSILAM